MIPQDYITQWRSVAPWLENRQVEQDLILSRVLVEIFSNDFLKNELAFRGGTALNKLFIKPPARYSEDIDLVRTSNGDIGEIVDALRKRLDSWLGKPKRKNTKQSFKLYYHFNPEDDPQIKLRIKIEINVVETFSILNRITIPFSVNSPWFSGEANISTFQPEEIFATKIRALYQRSKGRDVFDLWLALKQLNLDIKKTIDIFNQSMRKNSQSVSKKDFENNLDEKLNNNSFLGDITALLSPELKATHANSMTTEDGELMTAEASEAMTTEGWDLNEAAKEVKDKILIHLPD